MSVTKFLTTFSLGVITFTIAAPASAAKIGFATSNGSVQANDPFDIGWVDRLTNQGHNVVVIGDNEPLPVGETADGFELIIVSSDVNSGNYIGGPVGLATNAAQIIYESGTFDELFRSESNFNPDPGHTDFDIVAAGHPLAAGLAAGSHTVFTAAQSINTSSLHGGTINPNVTVIARDAGGEPVLVELLHGLETQTIGTNQGLKIGFFPDDDNDFAAYNANALALLDAAVAYGLANKVPEPSTALLMSVGLFAVAWRRRMS